MPHLRATLTCNILHNAGLALWSRLFFFGILPTWGRHFNYRSSGSCASSVRILMSPSRRFVYNSTSVSVFLSFGGHSRPPPVFSLLHRLHLSLHISLASLVFSPMFAIPDFPNPPYSHHPHQRSHFCSS